MADHRRLSPTQEQVWISEQLGPGGSAFHLVSATELSGPVDAAALERALGAVAGRHDGLRAAFPQVDGTPVVTVSEQAVVHWEQEHAGSYDEALRRAREIADRPFRLSERGAWRAALLRVHETRHLLVLVLHRIVADEAGLGVVLAELGAAYRALRDVGHWSPEAVPAAYADQAPPDRWRADLDHWRAALAGIPAELDLHTDRTRPAHPTLRSFAAAAVLPDEVRARLHAYAAASGVTPAAVLTAAWAATLCRHGAGPELAVGMPVTAAPAGIVGSFRNVLPVPVRVADEQSFAELVGRVHDEIGAAEAHGRVPFGRLVEELQPERDVNRTPLFQTLLSYGDRAELRLPGVAARAVAVDTSYAETDLVLTVEDSPAGPATGIALKCRADLFEPSVPGRMLARFVQVLDDATADPARPVRRLRLLDDAERAMIDGFAAGPRVPLPAVPSTMDLIEATVRRRPGAVAVRAGGTTLTYAELDAVADRLAARLSAEGAGPGTVVALHLGRSWQMLAAMLATWKTGAAYLPVDPTYPRQRTGYMLADAGACLVVTDPAGHPDELPELDLPVVDVAALIAAGPPVTVTVDRGGSRPDSAAYLIYTSGSTGAPKGVEVPHRAVVNFLASMSRLPGCGADDTVLALTSPSFDIAVLELFLPLLVGGVVVVASQEEAVDPVRLAALIRDEGVTVVQATPVTWNQLTGVAGDLRIRLALCGGERLTRPLADRLAAIAEQAWNMYGPTETTVWSLIAPLTAGDPGVVPIGRPIENTTAWVLDGHLELAPIGVAGELCIGGAGLAVGYHDLPEVTRQRFVTGPSGERLYRTGDNVRLTASGEFVILGRADNQVKINGHRIELDEISALLRRHPAVADAVTVVHQDGTDTPRLVSFVIPAGT
ncbi:non-ribosomal peptide synthetase [Plantactinospora sp. CA-290183]|uniref:non-ribosomal peptide synthetase n=1 Tax=Plantactinospora sp. CA-290183 TaxID=3240006 RepID=UPI003D9291B2